MSTPQMTDHTNDQDLGAALGNALHNRVDGVPTLTPGFDGVERRAAQITRRRRALAGIATAAVVALAGIGVAQMLETDERTTDTVDSPDGTDVTPDPQEQGPDVTVDPPTTVVPAEDVTPPAPAPGPDEAPAATGWATPLVVVRDDAVLRFDTDGSQTIVHQSIDPLLQGFVAPDGTVVIVRDASSGNEVVSISPDGTETVLSADGFLPGVVEVDGRTVAFVGDTPDFSATDEEQTATDLRMVDVETGESTVFIADAYGIEWNVQFVHRGADRILTNYGVRTFDGTFLDLPRPDDGRYGEGYGDPMAEDQGLPQPGDAVLSADGRMLWFVESPPYTYDPDSLASDPISGVTLRSLDLDTGTDGPRIEVSLPDAETRLSVELDHDGTHFVLSPYANDFDYVANQPSLTRYAPILVGLDGTVAPLALPPGDYHYIDG